MDWRSKLEELEDKLEWNTVMELVEYIITKGEVEGGFRGNYFRTFGQTTDGSYLTRLNRYPLFVADTLLESVYLSVVNYFEVLDTP